MNFSKFSKFFLIAVFFIGLILPFFVFAADPVKFCAQVTIPGFDLFTKGKCTPVSVNTIADTASGMYKFIAGIAGIAAVIVMMAGGYVWLFAGGNASKVTEAKSLITSAVLGLFLVLGSYMILNLINPELIKLKSLDRIGKITPIKVDKITATKICSSGERAEAFKKDENFKCGSFYPPISDKTAKSRCMDVYCPPESGGLGSSSICSLTSDSGGGLIGGNCVKSIAASHYYPADTTVKTQYGASCGKVSSGVVYWYVDSFCAGSGSPDENSCTLIVQEGGHADLDVQQDNSATLSGFYKTPACRSKISL